MNRDVDSLLAQNIPSENYEVILVDDGSKDGGGEVCDYYRDTYSNVITIHKNNGGAASARNIGLEISKGKYIMFVDSDDCIKINTLGNLLTVAEQYNTEICTYEMEQFTTA